MALTGTRQSVPQQLLMLALNEKFGEERSETDHQYLACEMCDLFFFFKQKPNLVPSEYGLGGLTITLSHGNQK